ncbi:ribonuclease HII [Nonomuraea africana]|uniref:Ribonuclease n=1 Tax=Nonomuraea africana TaxID=46171 RepID=A0ABR9KRX5_9ACTN|nr:ribonuclease HII [Nonomuraea africana]MBE1564282.1 ribonuclease HII [Nonomuraea africana]
MAPTYSIETLLSGPRGKIVAGIDEVGRGAWAGPVTVCAVVTDLSPPPAGLTDSKQLSAGRRAALVPLLESWARGIGYGEASHTEIDALGMTEALRRAAHRALEALPVRPDVVILDGSHDYIGSPWPVRLEVKGDQASISVAAASVLAKERRDAYMGTIGCEEYGFGENAGYPSPVHQGALATHGPTAHHRLSWSYLDDLPQWRHLKIHRDAAVGEGQISLFG